jgi:hypothetical protein
MNKMLQILSDYEGIAIVADPKLGNLDGFFRRYNDCIYVQSFRHGGDTPFAEVPWIMRDATEEEIAHSSFLAMKPDTWHEISLIYLSDQIREPCPLVLIGKHQRYAIDAAAPPWPLAVANIVEKTVK